MSKIARQVLLSPPVTLSAAVLAGVFEFLALQRVHAVDVVRGQLAQLKH